MDESVEAASSVPHQAARPGAGTSAAGSSQLVTVDMGEGRTILIDARIDSEPDPERRVSIRQKVPFDGVAESIDAISSRIVGALQRAKPDRATVEFGLDVGVESGQLTSMLVKGSGTATIKVTLEWGTQE
jgi:hypothetical protein